MQNLHEIFDNIRRPLLETDQHNLKAEHILEASMTELLCLVHSTPTTNVPKGCTVKKRVRKVC